MTGEKLCRQKGLLLIVGLLLAAVMVSCGSENDGSGELKLTSAAFSAGEPVPAIYTCDGNDISPPLQWSSLPQGTASIALIMDDPDAPGRTWVHWVLYDLPPDLTSLPEQVASTVGVQGHSSWGRAGYGGPCPPRGTHRYFFRLYALDRLLDMAPGMEKEELLEAMDGRILDQAELMGTYERP